MTRNLCVGETEIESHYDFVGSMDLTGKYLRKELIGKMDLEGSIQQGII